MSTLFTPGHRIPFKLNLRMRLLHLLFFRHEQAHIDFDLESSFNDSSFVCDLFVAFQDYDCRAGGHETYLRNSPFRLSS